MRLSALPVFRGEVASPRSPPKAQYPRVAFLFERDQECRGMTEWNASEYARISALQASMAEEVLSLLNLKGTEHILDVGCGNGKTTAEIAARVPRGEVVGVDASADMIGFAAAHSHLHSNLKFAVADARNLPYQHQFDLVGRVRSGAVG